MLVSTLRVSLSCAQEALGQQRTRPRNQQGARPARTMCWRVEQWNCQHPGRGERFGSVAQLSSRLMRAQHITTST